MASLKLLKMKFKLPLNTAFIEVTLSPEFTKLFKVLITGNPAPTFVSNKNGALYFFDKRFSSL